MKHIRKLRWVLAAAVVYVGLVLALFYGGSMTPRPLKLGDKNAAWLAHRWFDDSDRKALEPGELERLAGRCQQAGIRYLFLHVGPLDAQGAIPPWDPERWRERASKLRAAMPQVKLLAWLGAPNADFEGKAKDTLDMAEEATLYGVAETAQELILSGFDGIHYDIEPIRDGDVHFLKLLELTRTELLSVATPHHRPHLVPPLPPFERQWTGAYYREVAKRSDQVVYMGYDTAQPNEALYSRWMRFQAATLRPLVPGELLIGVPTYDEEESLVHNPRAETLPAAWRGIRAAGGPAAIGLYAEWTTTDAEWETVIRFKDF